MATVELLTERMVAGGDAIAREPSGRVVFVTGALPGERVRARLTEEKADFARAVLVEVLAAAEARRPPPCPYVTAGCGGCGWQHVTEHGAGAAEGGHRAGGADPHRAAREPACRRRTGARPGRLPDHLAAGRRRRGSGRLPGPPEPRPGPGRRLHGGPPPAGRAARRPPLPGRVGGHPALRRSHRRAAGGGRTLRRGGARRAARRRRHRTEGPRTTRRSRASGSGSRRDRSSRAVPTVPRSS